VAEVDAQTGQNTFEVKATDQKGNVRTNQFRLDTTANGSARTLTYDLNGNCTQDGTTTYGWDAQNRLVWVVQGTKRSEFTYDGAGRRVRIVEKDGVTVLSDHRFVWVGSAIAERRDTGSNAVQIRFTGNGEVEGATKRYYARDHLGSVREVVDQAGAVLARYDYTPFGQRTRVGGTGATYVCTFGYTGHVHHEPTGMALTWFRAYVPASGRWLSRDPIGERGGLNYYGYAFNQPAQYSDPLGLCAYFYGGSNIPGSDYGHIGAGVDIYGANGNKIGILQVDYVSANRTMSGPGQLELQFFPIGSAAYADFLAKPGLITISGSHAADISLKNWFVRSGGRGFSAIFDKSMADGQQYSWIEPYTAKQPSLGLGFSNYEFLNNNCSVYSMSAAGIYMGTSVSPPNAAMVTPQQGMDAIRRVATGSKLAATGGCP
jgi:RHS repeat-associated protein